MGSGGGGMNDYQDYTVLWAPDTKTLTELVNRYLKMGYRPAGGVCAIPDSRLTKFLNEPRPGFYQAVVKVVGMV